MSTFEYHERMRSEMLRMEAVYERWRELWKVIERGHQELLRRRAAKAQGLTTSNR